VDRRGNATDGSVAAALLLDEVWAAERDRVATTPALTAMPNRVRREKYCIAARPPGIELNFDSIIRAKEFLMNKSASRRNFLATAGLALPAVGLARPADDKRPATPKSPARDAAPKFSYRTLGKTGLKPTAVGFGCMVTSDPTVVERAADIGITYFDTARGYQGGNNERMVGGALKGKRNSLILSSKTHASNKEGALADIDTSLKELGTDHLDIWYLHAKTKADQITDDLMEAQNIAKKAGKIRFAGISTHGGQKEVIPAAIAKKHFDVILTSYNFTMDASMNDLLKSAKDAGIGTVAMKVMAGGFRQVRQGNPRYDIFHRDGAMLAMLKWVLRNQNVDTTIPSITDFDQLDQNLRAMSEIFTPADEKLLAARLEHLAPLYCRMCGSCDGVCAKGLPVADLIRYVSYAEGYGEFAMARDQYLQLPTHLQSVRCGDCDECTVNCPNGVHVSARVTRAQELFA
jgi:aryl-alcohol dehydrogenase-like predicted oxidoreductase